MWACPALVFVLLCAGTLIQCVLLWTSFFVYTLPTQATLSDFSIEPYRQLFANPAFWIGLKNTALVAALSALIVTAIGATLGWIISRSQIRGRRILDFLSVMSVGIPAVIVGLAVMMLYLSMPIGVYGTIWILVLAYSYRFATRPGRARGFPPNPQGAGGSLGAIRARWLTTTGTYSPA